MTKIPNSPYYPSPLGGKGGVRGVRLFENWLLEFIWSLGFGYWNLNRLVKRSAFI
jgi:hypothetical protein